MASGIILMLQMLAQVPICRASPCSMKFICSARFEAFPANETGILFPDVDYSSCSIAAVHEEITGAVSGRRPLSGPDHNWFHESQNIKY